MKKQKVCALLCVAALSISSVTPAMAADLAETPQVEAGTEEQQEVVTDQANKEAPEGGSREEETQEEGTQEEEAPRKSQVMNRAFRKKRFPVTEFPMIQLRLRIRELSKATKKTAFPQMAGTPMKMEIHIIMKMEKNFRKSS